MKSLSLAAAFCMLALAGCADLTEGTTQVISVETRSGSQPVVGANCRLENSKGVWYITTPGTLKVRRDYDPLVVRCDRDGAAPGVAAVPSRTKEAMLGDIVAVPPIGAAIDAGSSAGYDYPPLITIQLNSHDQQYKSGK